MKSENNLLHTLLQKVSTSYAVLWEPDLLPSSSTVSHSLPSSLGVQGSAVSVDEESNSSCAEIDKSSSHADSISGVGLLEILDTEEDDLPIGLKIDTGPLACVACGVLGYPFMAIVQPSKTATKVLFSAIANEAHQNVEKLRSACIPSCLPHTAQKFGPVGICNISTEQENPDPYFKLSPVRNDHVAFLNEMGAGYDLKLLSDNGQGGDTSIKSNPSAKIEKSNAIASGTKPFSEIHSLNCVSVQQSSSANTKWTSVNVFNRPRIFCMQHALEVEELLHSKGGAHVLIICHSDYLKIKAYTPAIAEEVGMELNIADVPLENASSADLNLINISIDDGEHEEHGQDWTSKLGVNLRYCLKLRKQSTEKQEHLTLALGGIFSDSASVSDFSTLKWRSRRSRTPYKVVGLSIADSHVGANMEQSDMVERNLITNFDTKVYHSCRRKPNGLVGKHNGTNNEDIQTEFGSSCGNLIVNDGDDCSPAFHSHYLNERVENDDTGGLFTVPISSAVEGLQIQQGCWFQLEVTRADEVNSLSYESFLPCTLIPVFESSETCQGRSSQLEILRKCRADNSKNPDYQPNLLQPEAMDSVGRQEIEAFYETNSDCKVYDTADVVTEPTSHVAAANSEEIQGIQLTQEPNLIGSVGNIFPSSDQTSVLEVSFDNNDLHLEVPNSDVPKIEQNIFHALKLKGQLLRSLPTSDSLAMMEGEVPKVNLSTEELPVMEACSNHSSRSVELTADNVTTINKCQVEQEEIPQLEVPIAKEQFVDHLSTTDSLALMEKEVPKGNVSTEEVSMMETCVNHSSRSGEQGFSNVKQTSEGESVDPSRAERGNTCESWQEEIPSVENNFQGGMNTVRLAKSYEVKKSVKDKEHCWSNNVCSIQYVRRGTKRKQEEQIAESNNNKRNFRIIHTDREDQHISESFIRGPCEGLRPRSGWAMTPSERAGSTVKVLIKDKFKESYLCDIEGCHLKFRRKQDLKFHTQNRCTYNGCGKRFRSHKDLMRHQRVHEEERPLKCQWKGCQMSFKWEWARTEHLRIHTGERPYQCMVAGCELTFRYVSAFSRHRRKTGHCVNTVDH